VSAPDRAAAEAVTAQNGRDRVVQAAVRDLSKLVDAWLGWFDSGQDGEPPSMPERRIEIADHLGRVRIVLTELKQMGRERDALFEGNQRLQTMNEGLRQMAIEAREAANSWQQATIDLYSGREEPHPTGCSCGHLEASGTPEQPAPEPKGPTRRNVLLAAIQREGGDWSPLRARTALMNAGHDVASNLAAQEMKTLAAHGFLEQVRPRAYTYRLAASQQEPQCTSHAHPDFVEDQTIRICSQCSVESTAGYEWLVSCEAYRLRCIDSCSGSRTIG